MKRSVLFVLLTFLLVFTSVLAPCPDFLSKVGNFSGGGLQVASAADLSPVTVGTANTGEQVRLPIEFVEDKYTYSLNNQMFTLVFSKDGSDYDKVLTNTGDPLIDSTVFNLLATDKESKQYSLDIVGETTCVKHTPYEYEITRQVSDIPSEVVIDKDITITVYGITATVTWTIKTDENTVIALSVQSGSVEFTDITFNWTNSSTTAKEETVGNRATFTQKETWVGFDWSDIAKLPSATISSTSSRVPPEKEGELQKEVSQAVLSVGPLKTDDYLWVDPEIVGTSTTTNAIAYSNQRQTFYGASRYWVFYSDGANLVYSSSLDGITWADNVTLVSGLTDSKNFSLWWDLTYVHFAYSSGTDNTDLHYRRGLPDEDGVITLGTEQNAVAAVAGSTYLYPFITQDSSGYPVVSYTTAEDTDAGAICDTGGTSLSARTSINLNNPVATAGILDYVVIGVEMEIANCEVATFYNVSGNNYSTRDTESIGAVAVGVQTVAISLTAEVGDYIGIYYSAGSIYLETEGHSGIAGHAGDMIPVTDHTFTSYAGYITYLYAYSISSPFVTKANQNDGTWTTDNFNTQLSTTDDDNWRTTVLPAASQDLMVIYARDGQPVKSKIYDYSGSAFLTENTTTAAIQEGSFFSAVVDNDDVAHLVFSDNTEDIVYTHYHSGGTAWQTEEDVYEGTSVTMAPVLSKTIDDNLYCFWMGDNVTDHIYYKAQVSGTWDTTRTDWLTESSITDNASISCAYEQTTTNYIPVVWLTSASSPYNVRFAALERVLPGDWGGWQKRTEITVLGNGSEKISYSSLLDVYYNCPAVEGDSITQFLYQPASRYKDTNDRVYCVTTDYSGKVTVKSLDDATGEQSTSKQLWDHAAVSDHHGGSCLVLQHQTGALAGHNGTLLVAAAKFQVGTYSCRTDNNVDTTAWASVTWGDSVTINTSAGDAYPHLVETDDGTIFCFYGQQVGVTAERQKCFVTLKLAADPTNDTWSAEQVFVTHGTSYRVWYAKPCKDPVDGNTVHWGIGDVLVATNHYQDVYYAKQTGSYTGTADTNTDNKLDDTSADFVTAGVAAEWIVLNKTDNTWGRVGAVDDLHHLSITDAAGSALDLFPDGDEDYMLCSFTDAAGTVKHMPMDFSSAGHTPDLVRDTTVSGDIIESFWDITTDTSGNPYLLFLSAAADEEGTAADVYQCHYHDAAWSCHDTGINSFLVEDDWGAGAVMKEYDPDIMFTSIKDGANKGQIQAYESPSDNTTFYLADGNNGTTAICGDGKITQASPGHNWRPVWVVGANNPTWGAAAYFQCMWFYIEGDVDLDMAELTMRFAWPGFNTANYVGFKKECQADFEDLRFTFASTTPVSDSTGKPWFEEETDYWRALIWAGKYTVPAASSSTTLYCYYDHNQVGGARTNSNDQTVLEAVFLAGSHFEMAIGDADFTDQWDMTNTVTIDTHRLVLTGVAASRGIIETDTANFPDWGLGAEIRTKFYSSTTSPSANQVGMCEDGDLNDRAAVFLNAFGGAADQMTYMTVDAANTTTTNAASMGLTAYHTYAAQWSLNGIYAETRFYRDRGQTNRLFGAVRATHTTDAAPPPYVPSEDQVLYLYEGTDASDNTYVDWIWARPWTTEPTITVTNTVASVSITVSPTTWTEFYKEGASAHTHNLQMNSWYTSDNDSNKDYYTVTNDGGYACDILISSSDNWTGTGVHWHVSPTGDPGDHTIGIWCGLDSDSGYVILIKPDDPPNFLLTALAAAAHDHFGLKVFTCTSNGGNASMSGTITLTAVVHT